MFCTNQILVSRVAHAASAVVIGLAAAALGGCGQQGALYLPTEPAAARRATLPETLRPATATEPKSSTPVLPDARPPARAASQP